MDDLGLTGRLARWSARRRWPVVIAWFVGVAAVVVLSGVAGGVFVNDINFLDGRDSQVAKDRLEEARGKEPLVEQVVVQSSTVTTDSAEFRSFVEEVTADLRALTEHVEFAVSPHEEGATPLFSADGSAAIIQARVAGDIDDIQDHLPTIMAAIEERDGEGGFTVATFGFGSFNQTFNDLALEDLETELFAIPPAFIVLILVFGAVVAALVPMVLALLAIMLSVALATLLANIFPLQFFIQNMIFMLGLALGIDYALFIVARFREERRRGLERIDAITMSGNTAARAVLFSGGAVAISLLGLMLVPNTIFRAIAIGTIFAAAASVAVALTLLPAVIALLGDNINRLSVPLLVARASARRGARILGRLGAAGDGASLARSDRFLGDHARARCAGSGDQSRLQRREHAPRGRDGFAGVPHPRRAVLRRSLPTDGGRRAGGGRYAPGDHCRDRAARRRSRGRSGDPAQPEPHGRFERRRRPLPPHRVATRRRERPDRPRRARPPAHRYHSSGVRGRPRD